MKAYKVKYFDHISNKVYTLEQAKKHVEYLNSTFNDCNAHMIEIKELEKEQPLEINTDNNKSGTFLIDDGFDIPIKKKRKI